MGVRIPSCAVAAVVDGALQRLRMIGSPVVSVERRRIRDDPRQSPIRGGILGVRSGVSWRGTAFNLVGGSQHRAN